MWVTAVAVSACGGWLLSGSLDGIDFDWEGYCGMECLKGHNTCSCDWSDKFCGDKTPEELAKGVYYSAAGGRKRLKTSAGGIGPRERRRRHE